MSLAGDVATPCAQGVADWAAEIRTSDPHAYHWFKVALCLLAQDDLGSHSFLRVPLPYNPHVPPGQTAALGARDIVIDYTSPPESRKAYVWRCTLEGPGQRVTAVTFRRTPPAAEPSQSCRPRPRRRTSSPGRGATLGLIRAAAWLLPAGDRARYAEEYRSELFELACIGVSRFGQLSYSLRVFGHALLLRAALAAPQRREAR